jgi:uncharacterized protein
MMRRPALTARPRLLPQPPQIILFSSGQTTAVAKDAMIEVTDQVLREMVQAIVDEVAPERVILFGSRARGQAQPDSDVDLVVIEKEQFGPDRSRREEIDRIYRALARFLVPNDVLVFSQDELDIWKHAINHVLADVVREGKPLYERS